jgi:hypothetical protein
MNDFVKALIIFLFFVAVIVLLFPLYKKNMKKHVFPQNNTMCRKIHRVSNKMSNDVLNNMSNDEIDNGIKMMTATNYTGDVVIDTDKEKAIIDNYCKHISIIDECERELYGDKMYDDTSRDIASKTMNYVMNANKGLLSCDNEKNAPYSVEDNNENNGKKSYSLTEFAVVADDDRLVKNIIKSDRMSNLKTQ